MFLLMLLYLLLLGSILLFFAGCSSVPRCVVNVDDIDGLIHDQQRAQRPQEAEEHIL